MSVQRLKQLAIDPQAWVADGDDFDVVIVGAGMSGLYCAWRIAAEWRSSPELAQLAAARSNGLLKIAVIEWSDRVGGRLDSRIIAGMEHVPAELGGMRFTDSHQIVMQLVKRFNLPFDAFPMTPSSQFYLRGARFDEDSLKSGASVAPYALSPDERKQTPNMLFNFAITKACNYSDQWTDANWQWVKQYQTYSDSVYREVPFYDIGFWNLLYRTLSNEGYDYVWDGGGYNSNTINWNSAEAMPYMLTDFSVTPSFHRLKAGFHTLPAALAAQLPTLGCPIIGDCRLVRFDQKDGWQVCQVQRTRDSTVKASFRTRVLMLAMPRTSLELIEQDSEFFENQRVQYNIQAVLPQPAYKLFLAYEKRWWDKAEFYPGPTITDLPLRMTYDFGSESERGGAKDDQRTLLLAAYADMQADSFWSALERDKPFTQPPSWTAIGSEGGSVPPEAMCRMAEEMLVQTLSVGGTSPTPSKRIGAYYQDWSQQPYGGGYHAWATHYKAWEVMREVRRPMPDRNVFICGEAYSNGQGWVEGAVCTAESILEDFLHMPRLAGVPPDPVYVLLTPTPVKPGTLEARPSFLARESQHVF